MSFDRTKKLCSVIYSVIWFDKFQDKPKIQQPQARVKVLGTRLKIQLYFYHFVTAVWVYMRMFRRKSPKSLPAMWLSKKPLFKFVYVFASTKKTNPYANYPRQAELAWFEFPTRYRKHFPRFRTCKDSEMFLGKACLGDSDDLFLFHC